MLSAFKRLREDMRRPKLPSDILTDEASTCRAIEPFTKTSIERRVSLIRATQYVVENAIAGAVVETGVWRGGSMMAVARTLLQAGDCGRPLFLYDTYSGMSAPGPKDLKYDGTSAQKILNGTKKNIGTWCYADLADVTANMQETGYAKDLISFVVGKLEDTIPATLPESIALLRLDTDWYESTKHALDHLYPLLAPGGVLIIDDYGHWQGAKTAVDEYFSTLPHKPFLNRVDYTCRLAIKPH